MRRFQIPNAALAAGLALLLGGCSGETPTSPAPPPGPGAGGQGPCSTVITLSAFTLTPTTATPVRATVTKAGVPVPNGTSVQFTTDLGFFGEIGLQTISKVITDGVADVTVFSLSGGRAHVTAVFDCAKSQLNLDFSGPPSVGPFISSISPSTGSCAGGDLITIFGGRFTGAIDVRFGGVSGSIVTSSETQIIVRSPARTPANPALPETVDLVVIAGGLSTAPVPFTFVCAPLTPVIFSISPTTGPDDASTRVTIFGDGFQFPMQVFMTGTPCVNPVEAQASDITLTTIVFKTPVAAGPNACLAGQIAGIQITNPQTNKTAISPVPFRYFTPPTPPVPPAPTIATTTLPDGTRGSAYAAALVATGGTPPYTWSVISGALPGLAVSAGGFISGTPTASGLFSFSVKVTDAAGGTATAVLSINVLAPPLPAIPAQALAGGDTGSAYSATLVATGGVPPYNWSPAPISGAFPPGLSLGIGGSFTGTPTVAGTFSFTVRVSDSVGGTATSPTLTITINPPPAITTPSLLPAGTTGTPYSVQLAAVSGTPPYTWTLVGGTLPGGLTLSSAGLIAGVPTTVGTVTFNFTIRVTDSVSGTIGPTSAFSITVN